MPLVAVTGASGYVGGRLVQSLVNGGAPVRTVGRPAPPWLGALTADHRVADLAVDDLTHAFDGVTAVVHLAAPNEVTAGADPAGTIATTVAATRRTAAAARAAGVARFVYLSTVHVYGAGLAPDAVIDEATPTAPVHPYAQARLEAELAAVAEWPEGLVSFRLTNSVGAPAAPDVARWTLLVNDLCREAAVAGTLTLRSAGDQWRDFVPLADVVRIIGAATDEGAGALPAGTYNLGSGDCTTVRAMAELVQASVARRTGVTPALSAPDPTAPSPRPYRVDVSRLAAYGLRSESDLATAVDETAAFCIEHREHLST